MESGLGKLPLTAVSLSLLLAVFCTLSHIRVVQSASIRNEASATRTPNTGSGTMPCSNLTIGQRDSCDHDLLVTLYPRSTKSALFSPGKMTFARRLNEDIFTAGQLTPRQIKYAADSGFKSVLSIFDHDGERSQDGETVVISTAEEKYIVEDLSGMKFFKVLRRGDDWFSVTAVERMTEVYHQLELPALFHCERGVSVVLITLLYYANQTLYDPLFQPKVDITRFYEITRIHGLDFVELLNLTIPTVEAITGQDLPDSARSPNISLPTWFDYWRSFPIHYHWFTAGQINSKELNQIKKTGFVTVINIRAGLTNDKGPSQETVELINIRSRTPTYGTSTQPPRQSKEGLQKSVIDPSKPTTYISRSSSTNYESQNPEEFGDSIGYNEDLESSAVTFAGIGYSHMPLSKMEEFAEYIKTYKDQFIEIGKKGPVLVHCASGKRAALVVVLVAALQYDLSFEWALQRLKEMGMGISAEKEAHIYEVYKEYLLPDQRVEL